MEQLLDAIRSATATDATDDARTAGAQACRTILAALESNKGEPLSAAPPVPFTPPQLQVAVAALRSMSPDQLLDLAITRLKAALPPGASVAPVQPLKFQMLPVGLLNSGRGSNV